MSVIRSYWRMGLRGWLGLFFAALGLLFAALVIAPTPLQAAEPCAETLRGGLPASGCNRAFSLHVLEAEFVDEWRSQPAPPGRRWLALDLRFDNWMPMDLVFGLGYQEAVLVGSLERQLYLLVDDRLVLRARIDADAEHDDGFILPQVGSQQRVRVAFAVPQEALSTLSLRYYHDQYAVLKVPLLGEEKPLQEQREQALHNDDHDLLALGVQEVSVHDRWHEVAAPQGMQWLVVDLRGQGEWRTSADARALDAQAPFDEKIPLRRVMEYVQAPGLLQAVVDGRYGYVRDSTLSTLEETPALLPDAWAGGEAVFAVPKGAERIELVAYMPQFGGAAISADIRPTLRFTLRDGQPSTIAGEPLARIEDQPTPLTVHALHKLREFAGHQAAEGETLLLVEASMTNLSGVGGMMSVSQRLQPREPAGELLGTYQHATSELAEPFWLPANDEPRHFSLLYRYPADASTFEFEYGGVSVNRSLTLSHPIRLNGGK